MDRLESKMMGLSTGAAEWQPSGGSSASDLNPSQVKEFVPGQGWTAAAAQQQNEDEVRQHQQQAAATTIPATAATPAPKYRGLHSMSVSDAQWRYQREVAMEASRQMDPSDPRHKAIPPPYCNAFGLEPPNQKRSSMGYPSSTFLVTNRKDGQLYCLKRFDNVKSASPKIAAAVSEQWHALEHPSTVGLFQCFVAQRAVFFVHEYIPGARNLLEQLDGPLAEDVLWSCVAQLVSAVRAVHGKSLAVRTLRLRHVLSTCPDGSRLRLRLGSLGIIDTLEFESRKNVEDLQMEDIRDLGRLILSLAAGAEVAPSNQERFASFMAQNYSRDLYSLTMTLIKSVPQPPTITDISRAIAGHSFEEQAAAYREVDRVDQALAAEFNSGRAFRLLLKLGFVNERPEFGPNRRWAQSGDCYILSLFRDYGNHTFACFSLLIAAQYSTRQTAAVTPSWILAML